MAFSGAQTFFVDPTTVAGAAEVHLSRIKLYFKAKPGALVNKSGIQYPGVTMMIVPTEGGVPVIADTSSCPMVRVEYNSIRPSSDASVSTDFVFPDLDELRTGREYAMVVSFDGDEDFVLWKSVQGDPLIGTSGSPSPGSSGQYVGKWFDFISTPPSSNGVSTANTGIAGAANTSSVTDPTASYTQTSWRPLNSTDLKFGIFVARFTINGSSNLQPIAVANTLVPPSAVINNPTANVVVNTSTGVVTFVLPSARYEYAAYDYRTSKTADFRPGERVFQQACFYPDSKNPATIAVTANSARITAANLDLSTVFSGGTSIPEYIVVASGNTYVVRQVLSVEANGALTTSEAMPVTNGSAYFFKSPVAFVDSVFPTKLDGISTDLVVMRDSNANTTVRFVNNSVRSVTISAGGTGYSNTDYVVFSGFEQVTGKVVGGYVANAVLTTNSTGGIVNVGFSNVGAGFTNASAIVTTFANSTGGSTAGSGANLVANVGTMICSEYSFVQNTSGYANVTSFVNPSIGDVLLTSPIVNPLGTFLNAYVRLPYYKTADSAVIGGYAYYLDDSDGENDFFHVVQSVRAHPAFTKLRVLPSWSNEQKITFSGTGAASNGAGTSGTLASSITMTSNASVLYVQAASNSDFTTVKPGVLAVIYSRYQINNDYANENTNYGNASAKGITDKVNFANGTAAEDLLVFATMWKPPGTDVKVFARIHNAQDPEAFDDKDWTMLEVVSGAGLVSSQDDENDLVEVTYGFQQWPNTSFTLAGSVTTVSGNTTITGSNTTFSSNLAVGDLIRVYNPLFSNTNYGVCLVTSITNNTTLDVATAISNNGIVGGGMKVDKIGYKNQAFNNGLNDNVARYYSTTMAEYDTFDTMQFKVVLLSASDNLVPKVDNIRATGVSA